MPSSAWSSSRRQWLWGIVVVSAMVRQVWRRMWPVSLGSDFSLHTWLTITLFPSFERVGNSHSDFGNMMSPMVMAVRTISNMYLDKGSSNGSSDFILLGNGDRGFVEIDHSRQMVTRDPGRMPLRCLSLCISDRTDADTAIHTTKSRNMPVSPGARRRSPLASYPAAIGLPQLAGNLPAPSSLT